MGLGKRQGGRGIFDGIDGMGEKEFFDRKT
jgi:hypothetical protein